MLICGLVTGGERSKESITLGCSSMARGCPWIRAAPEAPTRHSLSTPSFASQVVVHFPRFFLHDLLQVCLASQGAEA